MYSLDLTDARPSYDGSRCFQRRVDLATLAEDQTSPRPRDTDTRLAGSFAHTDTFAASSPAPYHPETSSRAVSSLADTLEPTLLLWLVPIAAFLLSLTALFGVKLSKALMAKGLSCTLRAERRGWALSSWAVGRKVERDKKRTVDEPG